MRSRGPKPPGSVGPRASSDPPASGCGWSDEAAGRRPQQMPESTGEVGLIHEADLGRDVGDRLAVEESSARLVQPPPDDVPVRRDPEGIAEGAGEPSRR